MLAVGYNEMSHLIITSCSKREFTQKNGGWGVKVDDHDNILSDYNATTESYIFLSPNYVVITFYLSFIHVLTL